MRYRELMEKRKSRNLDKSVLDELKKYVNNGHYMSYTVIDKLGINPRTGYNTPVGIYSYPIIDSIYNNIDRAKRLDAVPYMGEAPFVWIFKPKNSQRGLYLSEYFQDDLNDDVKKLRKYCIDEKGMGETVFNTIYDNALTTATKKDYNWYIWNFTRLLAAYLVNYKNKSEWKDVAGNTLDIGIPVRVSYGILKDRAGIIKDIGEHGANVYFPYTDDYYNKSWFDFNELTGIDEKTYEEYSDFMKTKKFKISDEAKLDNLDNRTYLIKHINWFDDEITLSLLTSSIADIDHTISFDEFYAANTKFLSSYTKYPEKYAQLKFNIGDKARATNPNSEPSYNIVDINFDRGQVLLKRDDSNRIIRKLFKNFYAANPEYRSDTNESVIITEYEKNKDIAKSETIIWTYLLYRVLGYDFVDDSEGYGIIHNNEPIQTVFFNRAVIDVVDRFENPARRDINPFTDKNNTAKDFDNMDNNIITKWAKYYAKNNINISLMFPEHWKKAIPINSSKLQAHLILSDIGWKDYIRNINPDTIKILDNHYINYIKNLTTIPNSRHIWNYFNYFHDQNWPKGEQALLDKITSERYYELAFSYIKQVRLTRWPEIEPYILQSPELIYNYSYNIIKKRWPEAEIELINMYKNEDRPHIKDNILMYIEKYSKMFGIDLTNSIK